MRSRLEDRILDMKKITYLSSMSLDRLLKYDKCELNEHYDEIVDVFCFLNEQIGEKFNSLSEEFYSEG